MAGGGQATGITKKNAEAVASYHKRGYTFHHEEHAQ
jgi:hypothetical protein